MHGPTSPAKCVELCCVGKGSTHTPTGDTGEHEALLQEPNPPMVRMGKLVPNGDILIDNAVFRKQLCCKS